MSLNQCSSASAWLTLFSGTHLNTACTICQPQVTVNKAELQMVWAADPDGADKYIEAAKVILKQVLTVSQELRVFCMLLCSVSRQIVCLQLLLCDSCSPGGSTSCVAHCYCAPCVACSVARLTTSSLLKDAQRCSSKACSSKRMQMCFQLYVMAWQCLCRGCCPFTVKEGRMVT